MIRGTLPLGASKPLAIAPQVHYNPRCTNPKPLVKLGVCHKYRAY